MRQLPQPTFHCARVRAAADGVTFDPTDSRSVQILLPYLRELAKCYEFAIEVLRLLTPDDFFGVAHLDEGPHDEYAVRIPEILAKRFRLGGLRSWYVKLRLVEDDGDYVIIFSLHPLENDAFRVGGLLKPDQHL